MRHSFAFPGHVRTAVREHIDKAVSSIDPRSFRQEPAYVAAVAAKLQGTVYDGSEGYVRFDSTCVDDHGRGAAEKWSGVDLVIRAEIRASGRTVRKAILFQAKRGRVDELPRGARERFLRQLEKMRNLTASPKILELEDVNGRTVSVLSGNRLMMGRSPMRYRLSNYFTQRVLTTFDGDTRPEFVGAVEDSRLTQLRVVANLDNRG